jgi:hypothetical protein
MIASEIGKRACHPRRRRWTRVALLFTAVAVIAGPLPAQQQAPQSQIDDRTLGEDEQIQRRLDWFYSTRRAGTTSATERAMLRRQGVEQTRRALERQRRERASGIRSQENFWVAKGPSPSTFGGWSFGNVSGRISSFAADWAGGVLYLGTASGGLWKSTNDGLSWMQMFDAAGTMTIGTAAVDPNDSNVIWVGTGENGRGCESYFGIGLLRSADGGASWETRNGNPGSSLEELASFANVVVDPRDSNHIITGGRIRNCVNGSTFTGGLYTSDDGGLNWAKRLSLEVYEIAQDPSVLDVYWAATSNGVFKSTNNGVTWIQQTASGLPSNGVGRTELAIAPSDSNVVYALFATGPAFWRTTDGGATWTQMSSGSQACDGQCWYNMVLRVHRTNPDVVYRGTVHIFKTTNGGTSWSDLSNNWGSSQKVHQDTHHLMMHPTNTDTFYVGGDGGIWKSSNGGSSFINLNGNLNITQFYAIGVDAGNPDVICGGAQDNSSLARTTSDVWSLQAVTGDGFVCHIDSQNPNWAYITSYPSGGYPRVSRSSTGVLGSFFGISAGGSGVIQNDRISWVTPYILDPVTPTTIYLGTHRVYKSVNRGDSWTQVGPPDLTGGSGSLIALEVNRNYPSYVYSGSASGRVWRSTNGGVAWTDISTGLPSRSINDIAADPSDPDRAFAVVGGFNTEHLWEWTASGGWAPLGNGLPNVPANTVLALSDLDVIVGVDTGVFRSTDGGQTVLPMMDGMPEGVVVTDLKYNAQQNLVTAGTYGRGAWQTSLAPVAPILLFDSIEQPPVEIDGDGDANIEPGETWSVRAVLRNAGGETALGVEGRLGTGSPGVTIVDSTPVGFGDIPGGVAAPSIDSVSFIVDPTFNCGESIVFDIFDLTSTNPPNSYADRSAAFSLTVIDGFEPPVPVNKLDEDFDPNPASGWTHEAGYENIPLCLLFHDEWQFASKGVDHGDSYHCGNGPGGTHGTLDYAWLYHGGRDSQSGPGIDLPAEATSATLTLVHWYDTSAGAAGGQVLIDGDDNDQDAYVTLEPNGGYPGGVLATNACNAMQGKQAFQGSSGGWVTSTFDLSPYVGRRIYLAFVFASGWLSSTGEGWYIDQVKVDSEEHGDPVCQVTQWPGSVPATVFLDYVSSDNIEVSWDGSCNGDALTSQAYSIQVGDFDLLNSTGTYSHAPLDGHCDLTSPTVITPGAGSEYYLLIPNEGGHDGGGGMDSAGTPRPATNNTCGLRRVTACL